MTEQNYNIAIGIVCVTIIGVVSILHGGDAFALTSVTTIIALLLGHQIGVQDNPTTGKGE